MKKYNKGLVIAVLVLVSPLLANAQNLSPIQQKIAASMAMDSRTDGERERDADRDPVNAMEFAGLKDNMTVIEFLPAGQAYYTKILGPVLVDNGHLMVVDSQSTFDSWDESWTADEKYAMTHQVPIESSYIGSEGRYAIEELKFGVPSNSTDMFLFVREYHNFNLEDAARINAKVFDTLKPGGSYVVIDHTRRHMAPETGVSGRREDPVAVITQVLAAGFVLDRVSDMFYEESDDLTAEVGQIANMTDRFFFVFKKPE